MKESDLEFVLAALVVIYKKVTKLENEQRGKTTMQNDSGYLKDLRQEAEKIINHIR